MTANLPDNALELRSLVTSHGTLELSLQEVPIPVPSANQALVRVEASPINPTGEFARERVLQPGVTGS
jgi:NADPH2:quinone reductase